MGFFQMAGAFAGGAADAYRKQQEANLQHLQAQAAQIKLQREQAIAADAAKLPKTGSYTPLEYTDPKTGTVIPGGDDGVKNYIHQQVGNIQDPDAQKAAALEFMKRVQPTKFGPLYTESDKVRDLANIAMQHGDWENGAKLTQTYFNTKKEQIETGNMDKINQAGDDFKTRAAAYQRAKQAAAQGDYGPMNDLAKNMQGSWNSDPNHDDGTTLHVQENPNGMPTTTLVDKSGKVLHSGDLSDDDFHTANGAMMMNDVYAANPEQYLKGQQVKNESTVARAHALTAQTGAAEAPSRIAVNTAQAGRLGAETDSTYALLPSHADLMAAQAEHARATAAYMRAGGRAIGQAAWSPTESTDDNGTPLSFNARTNELAPVKAAPGTGPVRFSPKQLGTGGRGGGQRPLTALGSNGLYQDDQGTVFRDTGDNGLQQVPTSASTTAFINALKSGRASAGQIRQGGALRLNAPPATQLQNQGSGLTLTPNGPYDRNVGFLDQGQQ